MIIKIFILAILKVLCSSNYDHEQNYGEYVPEIFMGTSVS